MPTKSFKPKVVLALIVKNGKFLLIRRKLPMFKLNWAFPGGVAHEDESEEEAVVRETKEEVGINIKIVKKLLERKHPNTLVQVAYFHCLPKGSAKPEIGEPYEIAEATWVPASDVLERFTSDVAPKIQRFILSQRKTKK
jgi:8-oxo-dGTP diphosphatase